MGFRTSSKGGFRGKKSSKKKEEKMLLEEKKEVEATKQGQLGDLSPKSFRAVNQKTKKKKYSQGKQKEGRAETKGRTP